MAITFAALALGLYFSRATLDSYDAQIMFVVAKSMATTHTTYVPPEEDGFKTSTPHASYGLGMSLLEVPPYLLARSLGRSPQALVMLINPVLFAAIALVIFAWARVAGAEPLRALVVALATSFGSMLLPYTQTGFSEVGTALGVAAAILGVELARRRVQTAGLVAGAGAGAAVLMRPDSVIVIAPLVAVALLLLARRALPFFVVAIGPEVALTAAYNLPGGMRYQGYTAQEVWSHPLWTGVAGLLVSPGRGVLLYVPLIVLVLVTLPWAWRRSPVVTGLCVALFLDRIVFYAAWHAWHAGWSWGPRFLVPAMPALAPLLLPVVQGLSRQRWAIAVAVTPVLALSVAVQLVGAAVRYDTDTDNLVMTEVSRDFPAPRGADVRQVYTSRPYQATVDRVLFDWRYFPIAEHARKVAERRDLTGRRTRWSNLLERRGNR